jgi:Raf kinase inhibitor-like YbhB/YbcL family protein
MRRIFLATLLLVACTQTEGAQMKISSSAFADGQSIPSVYTCDGNDTSPPLAVSGAPAGAKSLALVMDDPDAPGGTFDHWVVWNIPPNTTAIAEGQPPQGVAGRNSFRKNGYGGPCPPDREHRYFFKVYALDTMLNLPASATKADLEKAMKGHVIGQGQLMGRYNRVKK